MDKQGETTKRGISGDSQPVAKVQIPPALWLCIECAAIYAKELSNTRERSVTPNASVITLNPAIRDRVKSGHREWPKT